MAGVKRRLQNDSDIHALHKELDEVSCPICMDYPHNAVLLVCSSHDKGCRSYICDTSYRHSNCLDRFKKLKSNSTSRSISSFSRNSETPNNAFDNNTAISNGSLETLRGDSNTGNDDNQNYSGNLGAHAEGTPVVSGSVHVDDSSDSSVGTVCPLCRGAVLRWVVVQEARNYLNRKSRSCSREACSFTGNYMELRRHARRVHPMVRPSDIDPSRELAWRNIENQRSYEDIVSAIQSAIPGAVVVGDYVIENGDGGRFLNQRENEPWNTFFLFQMIGSMESGSGLRSRSQPRRRYHYRRRSSRGTSERRMLWGENLLGLQNEDENAEDIEAMFETNLFGNDDTPSPRRRRRLIQARSPAVREHL
ncbi:hypothetical protein SAY86_016660 [Trapa natans]|uniref:Uncharacterized protein n=1 Tax=Trapa natans TaxID=22666 RepID=A0AAN7LGF7_TRANT|nr:hypothetical protein SAY86_016660 [Trapa natans]